MLEHVLPGKLAAILNNVNYDYLNEIRLRSGKPVCVNLKGKTYFLNANGIAAGLEDAIICPAGIIEEVLLNASNNSLYSVNDEIVNGYISVAGGVRIGVAGDIVNQNGEVKTIKNIHSLNIRVPHEVRNCSLNIYPLIVKNGTVKSTLILSPPGSGKTTFIRDLSYQLSTREHGLNILIADERSEISGVINNNQILNIGDYADVYTNCTKKYAFENGIRSMKPDVIITDEINLERDLPCIENALTSGVKVIATIHASSMADLKNKKAFADTLSLGCFERFVILSSRSGPGTIEGVYNEHLVCIYC